MLEFGNTEDVRHWLARQSPEAMAVFVARAALRVVPTFSLAYGHNFSRPMQMFRCVDSAWAFGAYPGHRDRLISGALSTLDWAQPNAEWLQRSESAAISAVATVASHGRKRMSFAFEAVNSAIDAAEQKGGKKAVQELLAALSSEAAQLDQRIEPVTIVNQQLWPMPKPRVPVWIGDGWKSLTRKLLAEQENWEVWTNWYEDRLFGETPDATLELVRSTDVPNAEWREGPKSVNKFLVQYIRSAPKAPKSDGQQPPDPKDTYAFQQWLLRKPAEWASAIAARAALRMLANLGASPGDKTLLAILRGISAARYALLNPKKAKVVAAGATEQLSDHQTQIAIAAYYAASAIEADDAPSRATAIVSDLDHGIEAPARTEAVFQDALALVRGISPQALARAPLWHPMNSGETPPSVRQAWDNLAQTFLENGGHWQVWIDWYDFVLDGSQTDGERSESWEAAFVGDPKPLPWNADAASVNAEIAARIGAGYDLSDLSNQSTEVQSQGLPSQGYGPHFEISESGIIGFASAQAIDRQGNNLVRLTRLHPILRTLARDLVDALGHGNIPHHTLRDRATAYRDLIDQAIELIDFALLYVEGVRLANTSRAALSDPELPQPSHLVQEHLDSLLQLHGTFVLATSEGIELIAAEERYRRTPAEEIEYRAAAVNFAQSLQAEPSIIDPSAAALVLGTAEGIARGANPERNGVVASGTIKNLAIVISAAGVLGAASTAAVASGSPTIIVGSAVSALVLGEGLKKSKAFTSLAGLVTKGLDDAVDADTSEALKSISERFRPQLKFVLRIESQLRQLASQRDEFDWLNGILDWIKRQRG